MYSFTDVLELASDEPIRVLARVTVLRPEEGGREHPFTSGLRPNHNFGGPTDRVFYIGTVEVPGDEWVYPGDVRELAITFLGAEGISELLQVGRSWRLQEGPRLIATAEVLSILPEA